MAFVLQRDLSSGAEATGTNPALSHSNAVAGRLLVAYLYCSGSIASSPFTPGGFIDLGSVFTPGVKDCLVHMCYRVADGSENFTSWSWTVSSTYLITLLEFSFVGQGIQRSDPAGGTQVGAVTATSTTGTATSLAAGSLTYGPSGALKVAGLATALATTAKLVAGWTIQEQTDHGASAYAINSGADTSGPTWGWTTGSDAASVLNVLTEIPSPRKPRPTVPRAPIVRASHF